MARSPDLLAKGDFHSITGAVVVPAVGASETAVQEEFEGGWVAAVAADVTGFGVVVAAAG